MIFSLIILALIGGIAYFHYTQGLFSATLSAVCAVVAAALALSYQEPLVASLLRGKAADYATGMMIVALFAGIYVVLRTAFDKFVPGNIRLPLYVDRVGGAAMGLIAGIFAAGAFAIAAQALPFGPTIAGYSRYALDTDRSTTISVEGMRQRQDVEIVDQMREDTFVPESRSSLWLIPADEAVLGMVQHLSDGGSLAGEQPLAAMHPEYLDELYGQRIGMQVGAKRVAVNLEGQPPQVQVSGVYEFNRDLAKNQVDGELNQVHQRPVTVKPDGENKYPLVVRVLFGRGLADSDDLVRVSPGSIRLVAEGKNYWPVATIDKGTTAFTHKMDDHLIVNIKEKDRAADFLFMVPETILAGAAKDPAKKIRPGVFIEVKRLARVDLSDMQVKIGVPPPKSAKDDVIGLMRKPEIIKSRQQKATEEAAAAAPLAPGDVQIVTRLLVGKIQVDRSNPNAQNLTVLSGSVSLTNGKFSKLEIAPIESLQRVAGNDGSEELYVPEGQRLVQIAGTPSEGNPWAWAEELQKFELVDDKGKTYRPCGAWAKVKQKGTDKMAAVYDPAKPATLATAEGVPTDAWIAFLVPASTQLKQMNYAGKSIKEIEMGAN